MLEQLQNAFSNLPDFLWNIFLIACAIIIGLIIKFLFSIFLRWQAKTTDFSLVVSVIKRIGKPLNYFLPLLAFNFLLPLMHMRPAAFAVVDKCIEIALTISFAAILIGIVKIAEDYFYHTYDFHKTDNLKERKIRTQLQFLRKVFISVIIILTVCVILLSFESMRKIGAGLLTGVGVGGIIIGFAAQKSLGNLLAGFQIAFTQPMRIDDVLVVEGEFGRVSEITLTYVVLTLWDSRSLILPINYFIEKPFQNWTRTGSAILGTVFLYLDYNIPIEAIRKEFTRLVNANPLWDKRVGVVQVTNITEKTVEVRVLISANNSGAAFDLRCYLRENLLNFVQTNYPESLPQTRVILHKEDAIKEAV